MSKDFEFQHSVTIEPATAQFCGCCPFAHNSHEGYSDTCIIFGGEIRQDRNYNHLRVKECIEAGKQAGK